MITRRHLLQAAVAALPASSLIAAKPNSKFGGVQIGTITYSFRTLPGKADELLKYCTELGISSVELMSDPAEAFAGMPGVRLGGFGGFGPPPGGPGGRPPGAPGGPGGPGPGGPGPGGRRQLTPEQQEAMRKAAEDRKAWRTSASMDKFKELRALYNNAGVSIDVFKLPLTEAMSDDEFEYVFTVAKTLGAKSITMELPTSEPLLKRIGQFADKHKVFVGYHNHMQVNPTSWDAALAISKYNSINLDAGHFTEAISASPIPFIKKMHGRISSMHLKDKKYGTEGGGNLPWGTGQVPIKEVLQLMKKEKYSWPANIELEYNIPGESNVMAEMANCLKFAKDALA
ncbi:MAG: sugar phosphate isomerase/epimerase [Acidobacteria bacterium]|nr:sugar phosphate isomerase/epimerase [Acidobacteriota bacterium]